MSIQSEIDRLATVKADLKAAINGASGATVGDVFSDYPTAITNGKSAIAAAITDKGVQTAADATFQQMATNIGAIESGNKSSNVFFEYIGQYYMNVELIATDLKSILIDETRGDGKKIFFRIFVSSCINGIALSDYVSEVIWLGSKYVGDQNSFTLEEVNTVIELLTNLYDLSAVMRSFSHLHQSDIESAKNYISQIFGMMGLSILYEPKQVLIGIPIGDIIAEIVTIKLGDSV